MKGNDKQKNFLPGDEWLYYKIYSGVKVADILLIEIIKPLTTELIDNNIINKWFFIRYLDPEPHLRVRFRLKDIENFSIVVLKLKVLLTSYIKDNQIWKLQIENYKREVIRYDTNYFDKIETLFYLDSEIITNIIINSKTDEERFIQLFIWLEKIFIFLNLDKKELLNFLEIMKIQFQREFEVDSNMKKKLSFKYRNLIPKLQSKKNLIFPFENRFSEVLDSLLILEKKNMLNNLLPSIIHMSINRCFLSNQRLYEMTLYDFYLENTNQNI
ncbi:thiopeptide-type bacteriocin biosynthesis protein [Polaribacter sp. IC073]|uniref:thiopeptide-type bacteriocin biosynthesis protein n=1 Tax=Polaribacter sp. IC073 TaxID=2508540 RepID=UPI0011BFABA9|nr:thiopeptide-type bacteriocin biosynthesis protein [Polaribacter sp. IC073]TXD49758.1 hypothetical protein ES045_00815 [Polaribacter sp. IC073]